MRVGQMIKKWRVLSDKNYKDVAREIGIGSGAYLRIESGKMPDAAALLKLQTWIFGEECNGTDKSSEGNASGFASVGSEPSSGDTNGEGN